MNAPYVLPGSKPRAHEEDTLQAAIVQHLKLLGSKDVLWWHTPNGGARSKRAAAKFKALGLRPGIPDLTFLFPDGHTAWMELKSAKGRLSPEQVHFRDWCTQYGIEHAVCSNIDSALSVLRAWGVLPKDQQREVQW